MLNWSAVDAIAVSSVRWTIAPLEMTGAAAYAEELVARARRAAAALLREDPAAGAERGRIPEGARGAVRNGAPVCAVRQAGFPRPRGGAFSAALANTERQIGGLLRAEAVGCWP